MSWVWEAGTKEEEVNLVCSEEFISISADEEGILFMTANLEFNLD